MGFLFPPFYNVHIWVIEMGVNKLTYPGGHIFVDVFMLISMSHLLFCFALKVQFLSS